MRYRVLYKSTEWRNAFVVADSEDEARAKFDAFEWESTEYLSNENEELVTIEEWT